MKDPTNNTFPPRTKAEIARENGAKSRGPITPEGKARASANSFRHGLTSKTVVLSNENRPVFDHMYQTYISLWNPVNEMEQDLIEEMVVCKWHERRIWGMETAELDFAMDTQLPEIKRKYDRIDGLTRTMLAFRQCADESHSMQLMLRYRGALNRQFHRALNQLIALRAKKVLDDAPPQPQPAWPEPDADPPPAPKQEQRNEPTPDPNLNKTNEPPATTGQPPTREARTTNHEPRITNYGLRATKDPENKPPGLF